MSQKRFDFQVADYIQDHQPAIDRIIALAEKHFKISIHPLEAFVMGTWCSNTRGASWCMNTLDEVIIEDIDRWLHRPTAKEVQKSLAKMSPNTRIKEPKEEVRKDASLDSFGVEA